MRSLHRTVKSAIALVFLLAGLCLPALAQNSEWYYGKPIRTVTFSGLQNIKASDLDGVTSAYIGKEFSDDLFADLLNRVFALDYFSDVIPEAVPGDAARKSVSIVLVVQENPVVSKVVFLGNSKIKNNELKDTVSVKAKDIYNQAKVLVDERALRNLYISKGFTSVHVSSTTEETAEGIVVTFRIDEGTTTVVTAINFQGNTIASDRTLSRKLTLKKEGVLNKGYFQESVLEVDKQALIAYYHDHGYIDAKIVDVVRDTTFNESKKREELAITFVLQEGSQYTFGGITFLGNKVFSTEQIQALVTMQPGDVFNETKLNESIIAVQQLYVNSGYTSNQFQPFVTKDPDTKTVTYQIVIEERNRSHVENIIVKGNERTKDYVITREIPIESGDIYSNTKLYSAMRSLYNLQYFSNIIPDVQMGSEENLVDVIFSVEEQNTVSLTAGLTFSGMGNSNEFPIALMASIQDTNLFGEGRSLSAGIKLATEEQSINFGYGQSWLFGLPISMNISAGFSHTKQYTLRNYLSPSSGDLETNSHFMEYHQLSFNVGASFSRWWTYDWAVLTATGGITGSMVYNIYDAALYTPVDYSVSAYGNNWSPSTAIYGKFSADGRDINYDPSKGWFVSEQLTWRGLIPRIGDFGETEFFLRSETKGELYFTLLDKPVTETWGVKLVLALYSGLSFQVPAVGTTIKDTSKLYVDGMFYGRGYQIYNTTYGRGNGMLANYAELRFPVAPGILSIDLFLDAVMIKPDLGAVFSDFANPNDWYFSWGPSLRLTMQQFPLRILLTNNFKFTSDGITSVNKFGVPLSDWWKNWNFTLSFNLVNK